MTHPAIVRICNFDETVDLREWADPKSRLRETPLKRFIAVHDDGRTATIDVLADDRGLTAGDIRISAPTKEQEFTEIRQACKSLLRDLAVATDGCLFTPLGWKVMPEPFLVFEVV